MIVNAPRVPELTVPSAAVPPARSGEPFGPITLPDGVAAVVLPAAVGDLTALHAAPAVADPSPFADVPRGTVLLVPGFTGSKEDFAPLMPLLAALGWDVWAYSQRGQADSVAPDGLGSYGLDAFAADACEIAALVGAGGPVHLVGHSFGGLVARAAALRSPEAFRDVVLLCSGPRGFGSSKENLRSIVDDGGSLGLWSNDNPGLVDVPTDNLKPADAFRKVRAEATSPDNLRGVIDILWDTTDRTIDLRETGLSVLVAHGATDDAWPQAWQKEMADVLAGPYRIIPDAGHCPAEENPVATADLLDAYWDRRLER